MTKTMRTAPPMVRLSHRILIESHSYNVGMYELQSDVFGFPKAPIMERAGREQVSMPGLTPLQKCAKVVHGKLRWTRKGKFLWMLRINRRLKEIPSPSHSRGRKWGPGYRQRGPPGLSKGDEAVLVGRILLTTTDPFKEMPLGLPTPTPQQTSLLQEIVEQSRTCFYRKVLTFH